MPYWGNSSGIGNSLPILMTTKDGFWGLACVLVPVGGNAISVMRGSFIRNQDWSGINSLYQLLSAEIRTVTRFCW